MISPRTIEQVQQAARIEEVVGEFITLKRAGANMKGLCPFHNEKTPSFTVSPSKGLFKCFGCGKAGNSITFLMEHDSMDFVEAVRYLARKYNIQVEEDDNGEDSAVYAEQKQLRESLKITLEAATEKFEENLFETEEGKNLGLSYFKERGYQVDTIKKFRLGYAPRNFTGLYEFLSKAGYKEEYLEQAGLVKKREDGSFRDVFVERVMFPFHDLSGKIVGFGGRHFNKENGPKYLNTPETELYKKSDLLYGIFYAKNAIKKNERCFLVEGYTDVITLHQSGIENVVASSGTSLTEGQLRQIARFTRNITVIYDGDNAGIKASLRGSDMALAQGMNTRVVLLPPEEDPDSYCKKVGGEAFEKYIREQEKDFILYKAEKLFAEAANDPLKKAETIREVVASISLIPDALIRSTYIGAIAEKYEIEGVVLQNEIKKQRIKRVTTSGEDAQLLYEYEKQEVARNIPIVTEIPIGDPQEKALAEILIKAAEQQYHSEEGKIKEFIFYHLENDEFVFDNKLYEKIVMRAKEAFLKGIPLDEQFFMSGEDMEQISFSASTLAEKYRISPLWEARHEISITPIEKNYSSEADEIMLHLKLRKLHKYLEGLTHDIQLADSEEVLQEKLNQHIMVKSMQVEIANRIGAAII